MQCNKCDKEIVSEEVEGTMGMKVGYCCDEYQVDMDSLRPKAKQAIISKNECIFDILLECLSE